MGVTCVLPHPPKHKVTPQACTVWRLCACRGHGPSHNNNNDNTNNNHNTMYNNLPYGSVRRETVSLDAGTLGLMLNQHLWLRNLIR